MAASLRHHPYVGYAHAGDAGEGALWCRLSFQEDDVHALQMDWVSNLIVGLHLLEHQSVWEGRHDDGHGILV